MKKLRNTRSFLCGMLAATLLSGLVGTALAANVITKELYYNDIKIQLNGKAIELKDATGNKVEPFVIEGTTYLPVRAVGEALGLNVSWDGDTQTVKLDKIPEAVSLLDVNCKSGGYSSSGENDDLCLATDSSQYSKFMTPRKSLTYDFTATPYDRFSGTLFVQAHLPKSIDTSYQNRVQVYLDGTMIYTSGALTANSSSIPFDVSIAGGKEFVIEVQCRKTDNEEWRYADQEKAFISIGNPSLWK